MRLEKYINEATYSDQQILDFYSRKDIYEPLVEKEISLFFDKWKEVKKNCQPYLRTIKKNKKLFLFRGMSGRHDSIGLKTVRKNRRPLDTDEYVHDMVNGVMEDLFGWKVRSEGIFVTGNPAQASRYGSINIVFPVGKYEYLWSEEANDSYVYLRSMYIFKLLTNEHRSEMMEAFNKSEELKKMYSSYDDVERDLKLGDAIEKPMFQRAFGDLIEMAIEKILVDILKYRDNNLEKAIMLGKEITVRCDSYYYFDTIYEDILSIALWGV